MVFVQGFVVAQHVDVLVFVHRIQQLFGNELFQMSHGGQRRTSDELSLQVFAILAVGVALEAQVDLFVEPVEVHVGVGVRRHGRFGFRRLLFFAFLLQGLVLGTRKAAIRVKLALSLVLVGSASPDFVGRPGTAGSDRCQFR